MKIGDWVIDERNRHIFKIDKIWGDWLLWDNANDAGDVSKVDDCRLAEGFEIAEELERRLDIVKCAYHDRESDIDFYLSQLREIDTHIRSTSDPIPYIIKTLKGCLPEYQYEWE